MTGDWRVSQDTLARYFNTSAFTGNATGQFGNAGRAIIQGRANWNLDAALWRAFPVREYLKLDVRLEAFNLLNHPNFVGYSGTYGNGAAPGAGFGAPLAGITSQLPARSLQFSFKASF